MTEIAAGIAATVLLPITGWTLNKVVQHERKIAVLEQIAGDIRNSLKRLEDFFDAESQSRREAAQSGHRGGYR